MCWRQESRRSGRGRSRRRSTVADQALVVSNQNRCERYILDPRSYTTDLLFYVVDPICYVVCSLVYVLEPQGYVMDPDCYVLTLTLVW